MMMCAGTINPLSAPYVVQNEWLCMANLGPTPFKVKA